MARKKSATKATVPDKSVDVASTRSPEMLDFTNAWKLRLKQRIQELNLNPRQAAIRANLHGTTVRNILETPRGAGIDTLHSIASALGTSVHYLITGNEPMTVSGPGSAGDIAGDVQMVPVLRWEDIEPWTKGDESIMPERFEVAEPIDPPNGRFRIEMRGKSMVGVADDGNILDCSTAFPVDPEDIVVVRKAATRQVLVRRIYPEAWDRDGRIKQARLRPMAEGWPEIDFSIEAGDVVLGVVLDAIRPLKAGVRRRSRRAYH